MEFARWCLFPTSSLKIGAKKFTPNFTYEGTKYFHTGVGIIGVNYLCGFHSYISILVWKLFIPFGTVRTSEHFSIVPLKSCDLVWFGLGLSLPVLCGGRTSHHFSIGPL